MRSFGFPAFYLPPFLIYSVSCAQCRPPLSVTRLDSFPPVSYSIEAPSSLQSTTHSLCFASPLVCSLSLYLLSLSLYLSSLPFYSLSLSSSSVLLLYVSHVVSFTLSLSLGSLPLFRFPFRRRLYRHLGLSDRRLTYPPPILLAVVSCFAQPSTRSLLARYSFYSI